MDKLPRGQGMLNPTKKRISVDERRASRRPFEVRAQRTAAFVYCRVSDNKSVKSDLSIPDQERQARARATEQGWDILRVYRELGVSAKTTDRPEFQKMIKEALGSHHPVQKIIVHSISRFARNVEDYNRITNQLYDQGVEIVSLTQQFSNDTGGFIAETTSAVFDEYHSRRTSTDVTRTMTAMAKEGYAVGGAQPLGYKLEPDSINPRRKRIVIDIAEKPLVERIFRLALHGDGFGPPKGVKAIVDLLNKEGHRTRAGSRFSSNALHGILTNSIYMGLKIYNANPKTKRWSPAPAERVEIPVPAIITPEEFGELQKLLQSKDPRKGTARVVSSPLLLAGIAYCKCGASMTLRTGTGASKSVYRYYHCGRVSRQGKHDCSGPSVAEGQLDSIVAESVISQVLQVERLREILGLMKEKLALEALENKERVQELKQKLQISERAFKNLIETVASSETLATQPILIAKLNETEMEMTRTRNALKSMLAHGNNDIEVSDYRVQLFSSLLSERLRDPNKLRMKSYLMSIIARVEVGEKYVRVVGRLADLKSGILEESQDANEDSDRSSVRRYKRNWCS
ncbi:recombinase family protein [Rhizobium leguminosarum]|uniref:recombinase family protein n=1 Tax=Rhizobium leguminosarum TaxID=384 RepID=UPI0010302957|nr:recombinase family protein [Rhizobium leguminosarum]TBF65669.1 hypothetical protein ELG89_34505 [Rhizobium leguminosarum]